MASFIKFHSYSENLSEGEIDLGVDTLKIALTNSAPSSSADSVLADITQIAAGNGYTTGGNTINILSSSQSGGTYSLVGDDVVFTASGGSIADFRYIVMYDDTHASDALIAYADYGSTVSLSDGQTFTIDFGATIATLV